MGRTQSGLSSRRSTSCLRCAYPAAVNSGFWGHNQRTTARVVGKFMRMRTFHICHPKQALAGVGQPGGRAGVVTPRGGSNLAPGLRPPSSLPRLPLIPCVGVCGYPVRTECGSACGRQDLQTLFLLGSRTANGGMKGRRPACRLPHCTQHTTLPAPPTPTAPHVGSTVLYRYCTCAITSGAVSRAVKGVVIVAVIRRGEGGVKQRTAAVTAAGGRAWRSRPPEPGRYRGDIGEISGRYIGRAWLE